MSAAKRRSKTEVLAKELYEAGMTAADHGFIDWDDLPVAMQFCWAGVAEHVTKNYEPKDKTANRGR
jgi:hypothetical protein